jgi:hypothetical protein
MNLFGDAGIATLILEPVTPGVVGCLARISDSLRYGLGYSLPVLAAAVAKLPSPVPVLTSA